MISLAAELLKMIAFKRHIRKHFSSKNETSVRNKNKIITEIITEINKEGKTENENQSIIFNGYNNGGNWL